MIQAFTLSVVVEEAWIDALGHMNFLEYQALAQRALDCYWDEIVEDGVTAAFVIIQTKAVYKRELLQGDRLSVSVRLSQFDRRRMTVLVSISRGDMTACEIEMIGLAFDTQARRATYWSGDLLEKFDMLRHCSLPTSKG